MGGSLRRHKKHKPKIIKRKAKKRFVKSEAPELVRTAAADFQKRLGVEPEWDEQQHVEGNYEAQGLVADVNAGFGRNRRRDVLAEKAAADPAALDAEPDDEFKAACAQMRSTGPAAPKRLTSHQRAIVQRLLDSHGEDLAAMQHDRKLNPMQHTQATLRAMIASFRHWGEGSGVDFRAPHKSLW